MNDALDIVEGDLLVRGGRIAAVGVVPSHERVDRTIQARGALLPGLIQTHIHLCQTLFRGYADDLALLDWLRPHLADGSRAHGGLARASARYAASELLRGARPPC